MLAELEQRFHRVAPKHDFVSLRFLWERFERLSVRQNVVEPVAAGEETGAMITVRRGRGEGYAATSDLSEEGLQRAIASATAWAERTAEHAVVDFSKMPRPTGRGDYASPVVTPWRTIKLEEKLDLLREQSERLGTDERIVDWGASLMHAQVHSLLLSNEGARIEQRFEQLMPNLRAIANQGSITQVRTFGAEALGRQGGWEVLDQTGYRDAAPRIAEQALELLSAPNCPSGQLDLLLAPDQMVLQIHESIGHPLELDRILGDERNYAGTSFVTPDMFGSYRYGSELLNVTFDPSRPEQLASYGYDDEGRPARREHVIKDGILMRGLGGGTSQARAGLEGTSNSRASSWNRPPIDRMANLNVEPGSSSFEELLGQIEHGIYMETNCSWSIDDSRNKFQFGCEYARLVENGELGQVVRNPNYRGISATFWRSLKGVGNLDTFKVMGTPYCGKGEPNQLVRVGHASPACLFADVDVFGGA